MAEPNQSNREKEIFEQALDLPTLEQRHACLKKACGDDDALLARLLGLLRAHTGADGFLPGEPVAAGALTAIAAAALDSGVTLVSAVTERPGDRIGRYKLLEKIGEGGCGVVYMAEQEEPVRRRVALKVIQPGMDTKSVIARFEAERQALALMDHPNIAKIHDGGVTDTGRPFFVMELVRGIRITDYCDEHHLSTRQRLDLFTAVCSAVQHAHQKGIIHRDLKPSNILVTEIDGKPVPKVIDFGIARATGQRLTDKTVFTQFAQFVGTPAYMSPEQAALSGADIDTRSDIYSLGVLLYELLTGTTPFDAQELLKAGFDEMRRIIRETEPPKPSTRVTHIRTAPHTNLTTHGPHTNPPNHHITPGALRGDLDWIVMKALEKDRARRYGTANGLAADIHRHLTNEPVVARPASTAYRFQKALRRNKLAFSAAAAVAVILILGVMVSTWQALEASRARNAEKEQRLAGEQQRLRAEQGELTARQIAYASDMNLAHQAVKEDDLGRALELLERHRPVGVPPLGGSAEAPTTNSPDRLKPGLQPPDRLKPGLQPPDRLKAGFQQDLRGWEWRYLWRQCQGEERFILGEHTGGATAVGMLKDGKTVFSAGRDKCVRLWDLESRRQTGLLPHEEEVIGAAATPDGRWLATASSKYAEGQPVLLWDLATQKIAATLTDKYWLRPGSITFSPDSKWLAFATVWRGVRLWDVNALSEVPNLPKSDAATGGISFSHDSSTLAYNEDENGAILLWDLASHSVSRLPGHESTVTALAFSPVGQRLATATEDKTARLWNMAERREGLPFTNGNGAFSVLAFSHDGGTLAMSGEGGAGRVIRLVDVATGKEKAERRGHLGDVSGMAFTPDGQTLLSSSADGTIRVWDVVPEAKEKSAHPFARNSISTRSTSNGDALFLSPDGLHLLTIYNDQTGLTFSVWDTLRLAEGERHPLPFDDTWIAAVAAGGRLAAFGSKSGEVILWDVETGKARPFSRLDPNHVHRLVFSLDGRYLATADNAETGSQKAATNDPRRTVRVWDVSNRKETHLLSTEGEFPVSLTFSADSRVLMAGCWKGLLKLWPLDGQGEAATFPGHSVVQGLALLPDGQTFISVAGSLRFWDVGTRRENAPNVSPKAGGFSCLALSPDGRRFATGASDGRITIWDVASHHELATLKGHEESVRQLAFTPDGDDLVSVSKDQLRVWRAASWAEADAAEEEAGK